MLRMFASQSKGSLPPGLQAAHPVDHSNVTTQARRSLPPSMHNDASVSIVSLQLPLLSTSFGKKNLNVSFPGVYGPVITPLPALLSSWPSPILNMKLEYQSL